MFCEKCNRIYLDKVLIFCFSEIMGWEVIVAHQEPSTPKCDGTCGNHARITQRARVIRATKLMVCQSPIFLPPRNILQQKVSRRHMEFAIITILYLAGFLGVFFCFYQLAGILDRLTYQDQTVGSIKVWILKKLRYHHGHGVCNTNIDKLAHYKCLPPYSAVCDDMFQLLSNASFIDPPPKWKRART